MKVKIFVLNGFEFLKTNYIFNKIKWTAANIFSVCEQFYNEMGEKLLPVQLIQNST